MGKYRHVNARFFLVKNSMNKGEVKLLYCQTHLK